MTAMAWLLVMLAFTAGLLQAWLLHGSVLASARRGRSHAGLGALARLGLVAAVLVAAALIGPIVPAALGWFAGLAIGVAAALLAGRRSR
ncbi:MAG: hypothetical protein U1F43_28740 [Myxococcota bacterium]